MNQREENDLWLKQVFSVAEVEQALLALENVCEQGTVSKKKSVFVKLRSS